jgi:acetolactate synthase-1/2/3 large subunit
MGKHGDTEPLSSISVAERPVSRGDGDGDEGIAGWGTRTSEGAAKKNCSDAIAEGLFALGVREVFLVCGGAIAHLTTALAKARLSVRHFRHEAGAAFAAHEASVATARPVAVCVTTGPGLYNALTALAAVRADGGQVLLLSGATSPALRGRGAVQETGPETMPADLFVAGPLFHWARMLADPVELPAAFAQIAAGLQRPGGFLGHISVPSSVQSAPAPTGAWQPSLTVAPAGPWVDAVDTTLALLAKERWAVWAGFGATHASTELAELVRRTNCGVVCTPRAKGVFPETHENFVGVSGAGAHESVQRFVREHGIERWLVLGTRLGEVSSFFERALVPPKGLIQVDLAPDAFGTAFPGVPVVGIVSEIGRFLEALLDRMPERWSVQPSHHHSLPRPEHITPLDDQPVRTPYLFQEIQRVFIDDPRVDVTVMAEWGNSFAWANHLLRFASPGRYRTSAAYGSMGHFVTGVVGAAIARRAKSVVITGDGAMLMNNEVNTAVQYRAPAVWIVLNDARFGLSEHGYEALGLEPVETRIPRSNFADFARSLGADGVVVERERDLGPALDRALAAEGPFVVDVRIALDNVAPLLASRTKTLRSTNAPAR